MRRMFGNPFEHQNRQGQRNGDQEETQKSLEIIEELERRGIGGALDEKFLEARNKESDKKHSYEQLSRLEALMEFSLENPKPKDLATYEILVQIKWLLIELVYAIKEDKGKAQKTKKKVAHKSKDKDS